jgi:cell division septal protein FtsQ
VIRRSNRSSPAGRTLRPAALRPGARPGGSVRRTRPVRRASAGLTPVRAGAALAILAGIAAVYGLASSGAFAANRTTVTGATWTGEQRVLELLAIPPGTNLFTLRTADLEAQVESIPAIRDAGVSLALPDEVRVAVTEREALVVWAVYDRRYLVDGDGTVFAEIGPELPPEAQALPLVLDDRLTSLPLEVGDTLDPVSLDAALRLASLTPADVGSGASELVLRVDDQNGFTMRTRPASWTAVFGFYTPTLRTTELIPGQVRLLRSLLAGREASVSRVILADDESGTYVPVETPRPSRGEREDRTPKPTRSPRVRATSSPDGGAETGPTATP